MLTLGYLRQPHLKYFRCHEVVKPKADEQSIRLYFSQKLGINCIPLDVHDKPYLFLLPTLHVTEESSSQSIQIQLIRRHIHLD